MYIHFCEHNCVLVDVNQMKGASPMRYGSLPDLAPKSCMPGSADASFPNSFGFKLQVCNCTQ